MVHQIDKDGKQRVTVFIDTEYVLRELAEKDIVHVVRCKKCQWFTQTKVKTGYCELYNREKCVDGFCEQGEEERD